MPDPVPYKLVRTRTGKIRVKYACPHCEDVLESELAEAGQRDTCPTCSKPFTVPGEAKRREVEAELQQKAQAKQQAEQKEKELAAERAEIAAQRAKIEKENERKSLEALRVQQEIQAQQAEARRIEQKKQQLVTAENTQYASLTWYIDICRIVGWGVIGLYALGGTFFIVAGVLGLFMGEGVNGIPALVVAVLMGFALAAVGVICAFPFFVAGQLIQLALDARRDLAKLVEQKLLDS